MLRGRKFGGVSSRERRAEGGHKSRRSLGCRFRRGRNGSDALKIGAERVVVSFGREWEVERAGKGSRRE
jgi:hypothetical protein